MTLSEPIFNQQSSEDIQRMPAVLCISEDKSFLNTVRVNLGKSGFVVIITSNPTEAMVLTEENKLDVIVCDYELSQIDGISLFEKIRQNKEDAATPPTLIVTDKYAAPLLARCVTAGAQGLQSKNEPIEIIIERVISMLEDTELRNRLEISSPKRAIEGGTDLLTGVASRKHFSRRFSAESVASYRDHNAIGLLFMTVDRWDQKEERHGQRFMEGVLAQCAKIVEGELRSRDCVGRYSDHTFAVVLPETTLEAAKKVADRLRRIISATEFGNLDNPINITMSVGVSSRPQGVRASPSEMITQAMRSCTAAQELGGDRVVTDKKLTGCPICLVVGAMGSIQERLRDELEAANMEVRQLPTMTAATTMLETVPVKMIIQVGEPEDARGITFLEWARNRYPNIKRVLQFTEMNEALLLQAVNVAKVNYVLGSDWKKETFTSFINDIIYA